MRFVVLLTALSGALTSGCYLSHESGSPGVPTPRSGTPHSPESVDGGDGSNGWGDRDAEAAVGAADAADAGTMGTCERQCAACSGVFELAERECVAGCERRRAVAVDNGCEPEFTAWSDCVASGCDVGRCARRRSCF